MLQAGQIRKNVLQHLPYEPIPQQDMLIKSLSDFLENSNPLDVFMLQGYAGTGKTSIIASFVKTLSSLNIPLVLLAPTGRAAKVFSKFANHPVSTIHKRIYRVNSDNPADTKFYLAQNKDKNAVFFVDEASMIADAVPSQPSLLLHLFRHIYSAEGCRLILIGDTAQLPPVGQSDSPAMNEYNIRKFGLNPKKFILNKPVRQAAQSGILYNATLIRHNMSISPLPTPAIFASNFNDVEIISSEFFIEKLSDSYSQVGEEETIVITRSNKRAKQFNLGIRAMALYAEQELQRGERLVVAKNNYFWTKNINELDFIANGDIAKIVWIGNTEHKFGYRFTDAEIELANSQISIPVKILIDGLSSDLPSLSQQQTTDLYSQIISEDAENPNHENPLNIRQNEYFNALQVKYAYCLTCHKAQGGQWKHVYIDLGYLQADALNTDFYRWLYTAITRASQKVFFINPSIPTK